LCEERERRLLYETTPRESLCPFPMTTTTFKDEKGKEEEDHEDDEGDDDDGGSSSSSSKNDDKKITSSAVPKAKVSFVSRLLCVVGRLEKRHFFSILFVVDSKRSLISGVSLLTRVLVSTTTKTTTTRRPKKKKKKKKKKNRAPRFFFVWAKRGHDD